MFLRFHERRERGFTLVELIIVLAILGILVILALSRLNYSRARAANRACNTRMGEIKKAAEMYYLDTGAFFDDMVVDSTSQLVLQGYLKGVPAPNGAVGAWYTVGVDTTETAEVICGLLAHFGRPAAAGGPSQLGHP